MELVQLAFPGKKCTWFYKQTKSCITDFLFPHKPKFLPYSRHIVFLCFLGLSCYDYRMFIPSNTQKIIRCWLFDLIYMSLCYIIFWIEVPIFKKTRLTLRHFVSNRIHVLTEYEILMHTIVNISIKPRSKWHTQRSKIHFTGNWYVKMIPS